MTEFQVCWTFDDDPRTVRWTLDGPTLSQVPIDDGARAEDGDDDVDLHIRTSSRVVSAAVAPDLARSVLDRSIDPVGDMDAFIAVYAVYDTPAWHDAWTDFR